MNGHQFKIIGRAMVAAILLLLVVGARHIGMAEASPLSQAETPPPTNTPERVPYEPEVQPDSAPYNSISAATAQQLALAMGVPNSDIVAADLMGSDSNGVGVSDASLGEWFPTNGNTFAILSSGRAADASLPNSTGSLSTTLIGLNNNQGNDMVRLHLGLRVPNAINCLSFDFAFYSEEFPEWVGTQYNDVFTAQLNNPSINIVGNNVVAPGNFAFDTASNVISVNTVFGVHAQTGTTYDGVTPRLRARTGVTPNAMIDIYLSIQDLGDSVWDSSVFLDNFFWSADPNCEGGSQVDTDGDGLLDSWETNGLTVSVGGVNEFVNLPAMGANPQHKDIYVEIDYMGPPSPGGHTHKPQPAAIQMIVDAFNNAPVSNPDGTTGIHLHVDYGSDAPISSWSGSGTSATWGTLSHAEQLPHTTNLGTSSGGNYDWSAFDVIKQAHLTPGRAAVFHYNVWAHNLATAFGSTSGISRNSSGSEFGSGASDFIVSLGGWTGQVGSLNEQAGTFMHEFGHNLGLRHGGEDHTQWKPNYLSVMNYAMQTRGLIINSTVGNFDFSRYDLPDLNENSLNETVGINVPGAVTNTLGTYYFCGLDDLRQDTDARAVDWNCDGDQADTNVSRNINRGMSWNNNSTLDILTSQNDWDHLVFSGGAISQPGAVVTLPQSSEVIDIDKTEDATNPNTLPFISFYDVPASYWAWSEIERLFAAQFTGGCSDNPLAYCPERSVSRAEMAVFIERGIHGAAYVPPAGTGLVFNDVLPGYWALDWIEKLYAEHITGGCSLSPLSYCPERSITRAEMAVFLLKAEQGADYNPPAAVGIFADVPTTYWAASWIERLYAEGITGGCNSSPLSYCPERAVTRAEMAVFLVKTFNLP